MRLQLALEAKEVSAVAGHVDGVRGGGSRLGALYGAGAARGGAPRRLLAPLHELVQLEALVAAVVRGNLTER